MGIDGPLAGFSCWAWDFDNDGYLDIFATSFNPPLGDIVKGMTTGYSPSCFPNRLYRNMGGKGFKDVTGGSWTRHGLRRDGQQPLRLSTTTATWTCTSALAN